MVPPCFRLCLKGVCTGRICGAACPSIVVARDWTADGPGIFGARRSSRDSRGLDVVVGAIVAAGAASAGQAPGSKVRSGRYIGCRWTVCSRGRRVSYGNPCPFGFTSGGAPNGPVTVMSSELLQLARQGAQGLRAVRQWRAGTREHRTGSKHEPGDRRAEPQCAKALHVGESRGALTSHDLLASHAAPTGSRAALPLAT